MVARGRLLWLLMTAKDWTGTACVDSPCEIDPSGERDLARFQPAPASGMVEPCPFRHCTQNAPVSREPVRADCWVASAIRSRFEMEGSRNSLAELDLLIQALGGRSLLSGGVRLIAPLVARRTGRSEHGPKVLSGYEVSRSIIPKDYLPPNCLAAQLAPLGQVRGEAVYAVAVLRFKRLRRCTPAKRALHRRPGRFHSG